MNTQLFLTIVTAIFASTGFWAFVTFIVQRKDKKNDSVSAEGKMLLGLAHDRICTLGEEYIHQGHISKDDFENLYEYLYKPYLELGGNGTVKKIMDDVLKLPLREEDRDV